MDRKTLYLLLLGLSMAGYAWLGWNIVHEQGGDETPTLCIFKEITHLPCPACGTTRSLILLVHGKLRESLLTNPSGGMLAIAMIIVPLCILTDVLRKRDSFFRWYQSAEILLARKKWISIPTMTLLVVNWVWNISKGL
jgi:hypothetical protein